MIPETGFGIPDTQHFSRFTVMADVSTGMYPTFSSKLRVVEDHIVGSDNFEVQILGMGSARVTLALDFGSREEYRKLQGMLGQKMTLVLIADYTAFELERQHRRGQDYEYFTDTLLIDVSPEMRVGETVATATFLRSASGMGVSTT